MIYKSYGFLEVSETKTAVTVSFSGNMRNSENDAKKCFETLYGPNSWETLKSISYKWGPGSFDYYWSCKVKPDRFKKEFVA